MTKKPNYIWLIITMNPTDINITTTSTISIVIPCFNEEGNIEILFDQINCIIPTNVEYIFVDDHSSDNTLKVLEELAQQNNSVKYGLPTKFGTIFLKPLC
jgi:glycosyltransferase involved in cell wall biosynthesis